MKACRNIAFFHLAVGLRKGRVGGVRRSAFEFQLSHLLTFQRKDKAVQGNVEEVALLRQELQQDLLWPQSCPEWH